VALALILEEAWEVPKLSLKVVLVEVGEEAILF